MIYSHVSKLVLIIGCNYGVGLWAMIPVGLSLWDSLGPLGLPHTMMSGSQEGESHGEIYGTIIYYP